MGQHTGAHVFLSNTNTVSRLITVLNKVWESKQNTACIV